MSNSTIKVKEIKGFYVEISEDLPDFKVVPEMPEGSPESQKDQETFNGDKLTGGLSDKIHEKAVDIKETVVNVCSYIKGAFDEVTHPDEITVKFGIKLAGEQGIPLVTKGSAEATIGIEAKWNK